MIAGAVKSSEKPQKASQPSSPTRAHAPQPGTAAPQSTFAAATRPQIAGNMAVQRWVRAGAIQPKLMVNEPGDAYEQEADRIAAAVTNGEGNDAAGSDVAAPPLPFMQAKPDPAPARYAVPAPAALPTSSPGEPLPRAVHDQIEPVLGDLSHVRVHTDPAARDTAAGLQARAFTHQNHIYLGPEQCPDDMALLAHEATHVVQQTAGNASGLQGAIQRALFWGHTQHPNQPAYPRPPDPYPSGVQCDPRALAAMHTETVELKGTPDFKPSYWLAEGLNCAWPDPVWVRVHFGTLASGSILVRRMPPQTSMSAPGARPSGQGGLYETVDEHAFIPLTHSAFPGGGALASPKLFLTISNSVVTGSVGFFPWDRIPYYLYPQWYRVFTLERLLGWRGLTDVQPAGFINEVKGGMLRYELQNFTFGMQDLQSLAGFGSTQADYTGTGNFSVTDEATSFSAETLIQAPGISDGRMPLQRAGGRIFGSTSVTLTLAPTDAFGGVFSGSLRGNYANGIMTITGTARYRSRRLNGSVTMLVAPRAIAWAEVMRQLPTGAPGITVGAATAPGHVVVGWGSLDFHINEWLTGHASVVVDPDGYITSHGILRPTREFQFLDEPGRYEINRPIGKPLSVTTTFATAVIASLSGTVKADLRAGARIGPARLYGLEIEGQFSTRPGTVFTGRITGRANLSAQASIAASITGSLSGNFGTPPAHVEVVTVALNITGQATLRAYVELQPTFERIAGPNPDEAQYRITATLTAAGEIDLGLRGSVKFSIVRLGPRIDLGKVQYPLGSVGMQATISHILGSGEPIEIDVTAAEFNEGQYTGFVQDLFHEDAPENRGDHEADLTQPGGPPPPATPHPTELRVTFTMNGEPHTLWLEHTPGPVLKMASNGDDSLDTKLQNEIASVEQERQMREGAEADLLTAEAQSARSLLDRSMAVERSLGALESEARPNPDTAGFNELASGLTAHGAQFGKTDLAQAPPPPAAAVGQVKIDDKGRYVITNRDELEAVRAAKPSRPANLPASLEEMWEGYAGPRGYFDEAIRLINRDLTPPRRTVRHDPPLTWPAYIEARGFYDQLGQRKEFQTELRQTILAERGDVEPEQAEIDVGLKKGRGRTRYADLVITDSEGHLEVYSLKVRNVTAQTFRLANDDEVRRWIRSNLSTDVQDAIDYYGGRVQFRREFRSTPEGRAGKRGAGRHPRFGQMVFVNRVILVWKGTSDLVPERFRTYIISTGNELGATHRRTISCEVRLQP
jgi:Domain of unknown function (DUF4157)